jgi:hypothetical protein
MLGFDVSERTISRYMKRASRDPDPSKRWLTFLRNHREAIAAMDLFTVPTVTFSVFLCLPKIRSSPRVEVISPNEPLRSMCLRTLLESGGANSL